MTYIPWKDIKYHLHKIKTSEGFVTDFIELMTEFGKTGRYKFYIKVSTAFLCVNKGHVGAKVGAWFY